MLKGQQLACNSPLYSSHFKTGRRSVGIVLCPETSKYIQQFRFLDNISLLIRGPGTGLWGISVCHALQSTLDI